MTIRRHGSLICGIGVFLAVFLVFFQAYRFPFVTIDDALHTYENPLFKEFSLDSFLRVFRAPFQGLYIPVTYLVWWLESSLSKILLPTGDGSLSPVLFHSANIGIHAVNAVLVFMTFLRTGLSLWAAFLGALLFALHPFQVEPIAWVSALKDLLSGMFSLLALWIALGLNREWIHQRSERLRYLLAALCFMLALLSKPSSAMVPFMLFVLFWFQAKLRVKDILWVVLPWIILSVPLMVLTKLGQPDFFVENKIPLLWRPLVAGDAFVFYISKLLFPFALSVNYGRIPDLVIRNAAHTSIVLILVLALLFFLMKRNGSPRIWLVGGLLFILYLVPVSGLIPFYFQKYSTVSDRFCYLSLVGAGLVFGSYFSYFQRKAMRVLLVLMLLFLGARSFDQLKYWSSNESLLTRIGEVNPHADVFYSLGFMYSKQGNYEKAVQSYKRAVAQDFNHFASHNNLALLYMERHGYAEAEPHLSYAARLAPGSSEVQNNLGVIMLKRGDIEAARRLFLKAVLLGEKDGKASFNLGGLSEREHKWESAIKHYQTSLESSSDREAVRARIAAVFLQAGQKMVFPEKETVKKEE